MGFEEVEWIPRSTLARVRNAFCPAAELPKLKSWRKPDLSDPEWSAAAANESVLFAGGCGFVPSRRKNIDTPLRNKYSLANQ